MRVLYVVLVVVYILQACSGALIHRTSVLRHTVLGPFKPEPGGSETHRGIKGNDVTALKKYIRTTITNKENNYKTPGGTSEISNATLPRGQHTPAYKTGAQPGLHRSYDQQARQSESVSVSLTTSKHPDTPCPSHHHHYHLLGKPTFRKANTKNEGKQLPVRHLQPGTSLHTPIQIPEMRPCRNPRKGELQIATAPPDVCDLCPDVDGKNPLDPCTCVGVGGTSTGLISISCPSSLVSLEQLRDILHNTNFLVSHIFQFSLQGSSADGALTRDIWGDLDFKYVSINNNKITDIDNGAFIASSDTLISLNLANNKIKSYIAMYNDLPNLLSLNLRGNNISLIYSEDFTYPSLLDLDLSYNEITSIGTLSFAGLKKLKSLNLSNNQLVSIGDERFSFIDHNYSAVLVINLSNNSISSISTKAFLGIRNVEIDFRFNQLRTLDENIFYPIMKDSNYFVFFHFIGNKMVCDCSLLWVLQDSCALPCFDNFLCTNNNKYLYSLTIPDLGNCTLSE